jgi:HlyD family secretion protein
VDVIRDTSKRPKQIKRWLGVFVGLACLVAAGFYAAALPAAMPQVAKDAVYIGQVKRGDMLREVRAPGSLVPVETHWISNQTNGRVDRVFLQPGAAVQANTVILRLKNPQVEKQLIEANLDLKVAKAEFNALKAQMVSTVLDQDATIAAVNSQHKQAQLQFEAETKLAVEHIVSDVDLQKSQLRVEQLSIRLKIEHKRLTSLKNYNRSQLLASQARLDQLKQVLVFDQKMVDGLNIKAGTVGILQAMNVEPGQQLAQGTDLARVARSDRLKAQLRIQENQISEVSIGLVVSIDTRNGIVKGKVSRIDPEVNNGTVTVDVSLPNELPAGARPDLRVDGAIEIERLNDVLYVGKPVQGYNDRLVSLFVVDQSNIARRVQVELGRRSATTVEVLNGINEGHKVILSDVSAWQATDAIQLN